jgi:hypothetical protein
MVPPQAVQPAVSVAAPVDHGDAGGADSAVLQPSLGPDLQALIGHQLRAVYHEVLNEPVPDRFVRLLQELATKEAGRS